MQIIYQASILGKVFTKESRKVLDILKELTLGVETTDFDRAVHAVETMDATSEASALLSEDIL